MKKKHIIIGASAAGIGVLSKLRTLAPDDEILCIAAQAEMPFNTCLLANFLSTGIAPAGLYTRPESFFSRNHIDLKLNTWIASVDKPNQRVKDKQGNYYEYDNLFLGIGAIPRTLKTDFTPKSGFFYFHTLNDALAIDSFLRTNNPRTAIVVGAGFSGIECADALTERGIRVTVLDPATHPLSPFLTEQAGEMLDSMMATAGTTFYHTSKVKNILTEPFTGATVGVLLSEDVELYADIVIAAVGTQGHFSFGFDLGSSVIQGGILVNHYMQTDHNENIYCGGDAATVPTTHLSTYPGNTTHYRTNRSTTWPDAIQQGMIAAQSMAGKPVRYAGLTSITSSHFYGTQIVSSGNLKDFHDEIPISYIGENWHHSFIVKNDILVSFFMLGNIRNVGLYRKLLATQESFDISILDPLKTVASE